MAPKMAAFKKKCTEVGQKRPFSPIWSGKLLTFSESFGMDGNDKIW
jgi:hypothetical protein